MPRAGFRLVIEARVTSRHGATRMTQPFRSQQEIPRSEKMRPFDLEILHDPSINTQLGLHLWP